MAGSVSLLFLLVAVLCIFLTRTSCQENPLPTVYQYYTQGGIVSGLTANSLKEGFMLNGKPIRIFSASIHYFRVHPSYWRDRMQRARAAGILAIDTYVPWNLHEPQMNVYDFGDGNNDMSMFLNLRQYIEMAKEEDLLVILRPGPYICTEWDFGGLPSWLSRDPAMAVRSSNNAYESRVKIYFDNLIPRISDLQWTKGGPIIMVQIENEYGVFGTKDIPHLEFIKSVFESNGLVELFFTCDSPKAGGDKGAIPGVLQTANFFTRPEVQLDQLLIYQPDKPILIAEYWSGWFDHVLDPFHWTTTVPMFTNVMRTVLEKYNGSINFYMFHGGTNFGFMAGANSIPAETGLEPLLPYYAPDISSYDYNAPLSESGDHTAKYFVVANITEEFAIAKLHRPEFKPENPKIAYPSVKSQTYLSMEDILNQVPASMRVNSDKPTSMEMLPVNNNNGQSYGYILYRIKNQIIGNGSTIQTGKVRDHATLLVDGKMQNRPLLYIANILLDFGYWVKRRQTFKLNLPTTESRTIDLLVENMGRVNFGGPKDFLYQKGLHEGNVQINGQLVKDFEIFALEFKNEWVKSLTGWKPKPAGIKGPLFIQSTFEIEGEPKDTFLDMSNWHKGVIFVNGFNMGRYFKGGPATTTYVAAPFLKTGLNTITIFEQYNPLDVIVFRNTPNLGKSIPDFFNPTTTTTTTTTPPPTTPPPTPPPPTTPPPTTTTTATTPEPSTTVITETSTTEPGAPKSTTADSKSNSTTIEALNCLFVILILNFILF